MNGEVTFFYEIADVRSDPIITVSNTAVNGGGEIYARATAGNEDYIIRTAYFEFINLSSPTDVITYPALDRTRDVSYYTGLETSLDTDFVRVNIVVPPGYSSSGGSYADFMNISTFYAITSGTQGFWGKPFSDSANSTIYGIALAASPIPDQQEQDIIFSATYGGGVLRLPKPTNGHVSFIYPITHKVLD